MFADDTAFMAHNHQDALEIIPSFSKSTKTFDQKINLKKQVIYKSLLESHDISQNIQKGSQLPTLMKN